MRRVAEQAKAAQQARTTRSSRPDRVPVGQRHDRYAVAQLQRTLGNQTVQRLAEGSPGDPTARTAGSAFDPRRIPAHTGGPHAHQSQSNHAPTKSYTPAGNYATEAITPMPAPQLQRACACGGRPGPTGECAACRRKRLAGEQSPLIQPKLTVNQPGDRYEQEADRIADQVMRMPEPGLQRQFEPEEEEETLQTKLLASQITPLVQRQVGEEDEDELQMKAAANSVQRQMGEEDEEALQSKGKTGQVPTFTPNAHKGVSHLRQHSGTTLPASTRSFMEPRFGHDFSNVKVHTDKEAAYLSQSINARAFTVGNDIFFNRGELQPNTQSGKQLLAHELTHTIQQQKGNSCVFHSTRAQRKILIKPPQGKSFSYGTDEYIIYHYDLPPFIKSRSLKRILAKRYVSEFLERDTKKVFIGQEEIILISKEKRFNIIQKIIDKMEYSRHEYFEFSNIQEFVSEVWDRLEDFESSLDYFIEFIESVKYIRKKHDSMNEFDKEEMNKILSSMPEYLRRRLEKVLLTWPQGGRSRKMNQIIRIVTSYSRKSDIEESLQGHFSEVEGSKIQQGLSARAKDYAFDECLNFLYQASLDELFAEEEVVESAKSEYIKGKDKRLKHTKRHAKTLSRLASELRLQGLLGPVNILEWNDRKGRHEPAAGDLFERLSNAGDGWYFFLVGLISYHTFVIAVHVSLNSSKRRYFEIQGGQSISMSKEKLTKRFDTRYENTNKASSRVWQVYLTPK